MDADIAGLFPNSFGESSLLPNGWHFAPLGQEFDLTMGQSPPGSTYNEQGDGLPFYQGSADFRVRYPRRRVFCTAPTRLANAGDTLVSVRAPVGAINMALEPCAVGRGVAVVRHKSKSRSLTYYALSHLSPVLTAFDGEGTVFGSINKAAFNDLRMVTPCASLFDAFERVVGPLDDQIETNERQSATLSAIRDTLLPRLLSGELRVPDAEAMVGAIA